MVTKIIKGIAIVLILTGGALFVLLLRSPKAEPVRTENTGPILMAGDKAIPVTLAQTPEAREKGLSGSSSLAPQTGKLFIFDTAGLYGFWMKDMRYPIDIVWIAEDWKVVGVSASIAPETYPEAFFPPSLARYVLEVNAGDATALGLMPGVPLILKNDF